MFCEECGFKLEVGMRFCENCGTPVPVENNQNKDANELKWNEIFNSSDWQKKWQTFAKSAVCGAGILLTKSSALCAQLSCSKTELNGLLGDYCNFQKSRGLNYALFDLDENSLLQNSSNEVENIISVLETICKVFLPKYVFILGNEDVIDFVKWQNNSVDSDADVPSDFCYTVLCSTSPWKGLKYDFNSALRVGRLPTWHGESFSDFASYFKNAANALGKMGGIKPYGLSALVWKNETNSEFSAISRGTVDVSPAVTKFSVDSKISADRNLFLFNLHGSDQTEFWYGQDDDEYPEAFSPANMEKLSSPNFIGVEACYGAMYEGNKNKKSSNVLAAFCNKTVSLLGSSRIAYGTSNPPGSCADIVVGEFLKNISNGMTSGDAHISALQKLCASNMDDSDIKTLCEFALYGDPSASFAELKKVHTLAGFNSIRSNTFTSAKTKTAGFHVAIPDVRAAVELSLAKVDAKISEAINAHVWQKYPEMAAVEAEIYAVSSTRLYESVYKKNKSVVKIYFDSFGHIKKELTSK